MECRKFRFYYRFTIHYFVQSLDYLMRFNRKEIGTIISIRSNDSAARIYICRLLGSIKSVFRDDNAL